VLTPCTARGQASRSARPVAFMREVSRKTSRGAIDGRESRRHPRNPDPNPRSRARAGLLELRPQLAVAAIRKSAAGSRAAISAAVSRNSRVLLDRGQPSDGGYDARAGRISSAPAPALAPRRRWRASASNRNRAGSRGTWRHGRCDARAAARSRICGEMATIVSVAAPADDSRGERRVMPGLKYPSST